MGTLRGVWTRLKPMIEAAMNSPLRYSISLGATTDSVAGDLLGCTPQSGI